MLQYESHVAKNAKKPWTHLRECASKMRFSGMKLSGLKDGGILNNEKWVQGALWRSPQNKRFILGVLACLLYENALNELIYR